MSTNGFEIRVNYFGSPTLFVGCKVDKDKEISRKLNNICRFLADDCVPTSPEIGEVYGVYIKDDKQWVRGKIRKIQKSEGEVEDKYEVLLIDRGRFLWVDRKFLVQLNQTMKTDPPPQLLRFGIYGVLPIVQLDIKHRVILYKLFGNKTIYFHEKIRIKNIAFGDIFTKNKDKEPENFANVLLQYEFVRKCVNFEKEMQFCSVFDEFDECLRDFVSFKQQVNDNEDDIIQRRDLINITPKKIKSDLGYSLLGDSLTVPCLSEPITNQDTKPFVHEDVIFMPAGYKWIEQKGKEKVLKLPRTYYEIKRDENKSINRGQLEKEENINESDKQVLSLSNEEKTAVDKNENRQESNSNKNLLGKVISGNNCIAMDNSLATSNTSANKSNISSTYSSNNSVRNLGTSTSRNAGHSKVWPTVPELQKRRLKTTPERIGKAAFEAKSKNDKLENIAVEKGEEFETSTSEAESSIGEQPCKTGSILQNSDISTEQKRTALPSDIYSEKVETQKRMNALMSYTGPPISLNEDLLHIRYRRNQRLPRLMLTALGVLVHSKTDEVILPATTLSETGLSSNIIKRLVGLRMREISRVQSISYKMISMRRNLVMVGSRASGKTIGYVAPIASNLLDPEFYHKLPDGCEPKAVVITPSWSNGSDTATLFNELTKDIRVIQTYGGGAELEMKLKLLEGCDVLVSTPRCLLRLIKCGITNFKRLCHLVMDDADILFEKFKPEMEKILSLMHEVEDDRLKQALEVDLQVVIVSSRWTAPIRELSVSILANPTVIIGSQLEACVYADIKPVAYFSKSDRKAEKLGKLLTAIKGQLRTVVYCKSKKDVKFLHRLLIDAGIENVLAAHEDLTSTNISELPQMWSQTNGDLISLWENSQGALPVLVRSDELHEELPITNAQVLVHYNMPASQKTFSLRFISVLDNFHNIFHQEVNPCKTKCQVHILFDENNYIEMPGVMRFMKRLGTVLTPLVEATLERLEQEREEEKLEELLCENLKEFGYCWNFKNCPRRHILSKEKDLPQNVPKCGTVKLSVKTVHDACHFSAVLLEHSEKGGEWQKLPNKNLDISMEINVYYREMDNQRLHGRPSVGDLVGVQSSNDTYRRAVVLRICQVNKFKEPELVDIRLIDTGKYFYVLPVTQLFHLPASLSAHPPQVVDVYLCSMMPKDLDTYWNPATNLWVEDHLRKAKRSFPYGYFMGKVMLSLGDSIWLEPIAFMEDFSEEDYTLFRFSLRQDLLSTENVLENPDHLPNLYRLCEKAGIEIPKYEPEPPKQRKPCRQVTPRWAWLPLDDSEAVFVMTVHSPSVIFLRLTYSSDCLEKLLKELQVFAEEQRPQEDVRLLDIGCVCLGKSPEDDKWNRALVHNKPSDEEVELFFVDYGDLATVPWSDVAPISNDLIKKLPFQVIECYLAGIQFVESDDSNWEDDVIDQIYNLTRKDNVDAVNLHVKVCAVEPVGTLSKGKRYKVILSDTNKEETVVINKEIKSPNIVYHAKDNEEDFKTPTNDEAAGLDSKRQECEQPCMEIITSIGHQNRCAVSLPGQFNVDEKVAANENEERILQFLKDLSAEEFEYEPMQDYQLPGNIADISEDESCSNDSNLSIPQSKELLSLEPQPSGQSPSSYTGSLSSYSIKKKEICEILNEEYLASSISVIPELPSKKYSDIKPSSNHKVQDKKRLERLYKLVDDAMNRIALKNCPSSAPCATSPTSTTNYISPTGSKYKVTGVANQSTDMISPTLYRSVTAPNSSYTDDACENRSNEDNENKSNEKDFSLVDSILVEEQTNHANTYTGIVIEKNETNHESNSIEHFSDKEYTQESDSKNTPSGFVCDQSNPGTDQPPTNKCIKGKLLSDSKGSLETSNSELNQSEISWKISGRQVKGSCGYIPNEEEIFSCPTKMPVVRWHQNDKFIWLHIELPSVSQYRANWQVDSVELRAIHNKIPYHIYLKLCGGHKPKALKLSPKAFHFEIQLEKIVEGNWPRLLDSEVKPHWLKRNLEKCLEFEEETEDEEDPKCYLHDMPLYTRAGDSESDSESCTSDELEIGSLADHEEFMSESYHDLEVYKRV